VCSSDLVVGGIGLGIGYISPVSTLMKWFPDRPGMATGKAIMGFGGGALLGAPLGVQLMDHFKTKTFKLARGMMTMIESKFQLAVRKIILLELDPDPVQI
jgi:MFS family permease